jgi:hypothetical protein
LSHDDTDDLLHPSQRGKKKGKEVSLIANRTKYVGEFECNNFAAFLRVRVPNEDSSFLAERVTALVALSQFYNQHVYLLPLITLTQDAARGNDDDN